MQRRIALLVLFGLTACTSWALAPMSNDTAVIYSKSARIVARQLPQLHVSHARCNSQIATNAVELFISALDFDHSVFLESDITEFRQQAQDLDDQLQRGNLDFAFKVYDVFMARLSNRVDFANALLDKGINTDQDETYTWKRKSASWPKDQQEWDDLWRKKVKNQYLSRVVADTIAAEKKQKESATNQPPSATTNQVGTNVLAKLTPAESIRKDYQHYIGALNDNDVDWLLTLYISSFTHAFDPHSDYMSANNTEDFDINMKLSLVGIGALLVAEDGAAKIDRLLPGGPAERDGRLKVGDKIIAVGQGESAPVSILHLPLSKTVRLVRGEKNTKVVLRVIPAEDISGTEVKEIALIRDEVKLEERAAKGTLKTITDESGAQHLVGVLTIPDFYSDMHAEEKRQEQTRSLTKDTKKILTDFKKAGVEGIIMDLRNNGGGSLPESIDVTGLFIDSGPVVQAKSRTGQLQFLTDDNPEAYFTGPMVVLVNRLSASASEIVAGALKDYGRAVIVGDSKTHGKGTVQSLIPLSRYKPELGSLKVTTASFYRVPGDSTQLKGVPADIVIPSILEYMEMGEEYLPHAMAWSQVPPMHYHANTNLPNMIPTLKARSDVRRSANPRFVHYQELIRQLGEMRQSGTISLKLADRLALAHHEKEIIELIDDEELDDITLPENKPGKKGKTQPETDLVLDEAENVLVDLINMSSPTKIPVDKALAADAPKH